MILAVLLLGALVLSPNRGVPGAGQFEIVGRKAPDFALSGTKGIWRLRDHLGTPLIISFSGPLGAGRVGRTWMYWKSSMPAVGESLRSWAYVPNIGRGCRKSSGIIP